MNGDYLLGRGTVYLEPNQPRNTAPSPHRPIKRGEWVKLHPSVRAYIRALEKELSQQS